MNIKNFGASVILILVALVNASSVLIADTVNQDPAINFTLWSWLLAAVLIFPFSIKSVCREWSIIKLHWKLLALLAFLGASVCSCFAIEALHQEKLINAGLINGLTPIFIVLLSVLFCRKLVALTKLIGIAFGFFAVLLLVLGGNFTTLKYVTFNTGDLWMLGSVLAWATYSLFVDKVPKNLSLLSFLFVISVLGALFLFPFALWDALHGKRLLLNHTTFHGLLFTSIGTYIIGYLGWNKAISIIGAERAGFYLNLIPVFSMILSIIFFHTTIYWYDIVSLVCILIGLYLVNNEKKEIK